MRPQDLPVIGRILSFGPDDAVYDSLILFGPLVVGLLAVLGRNLLTITVCVAYVGTFVGYVVVTATRSADR